MRKSAQKVTARELRDRFDQVLRALRAGQTLVLFHRNLPVAEIIPLKHPAEVSAGDPIFRLHELAEPIGPLNNREIDANIYDV